MARTHAQMLDEGNSTTIFSSRDTMNSAERNAVESGENRGKQMSMSDDPKRFGLARQAAINKKKYDAGYLKAFGHE